jgi:putative restriction endonuclease
VSTGCDSPGLRNIRVKSHRAPASLEGGLHLVNPYKGIYRPAGLPYAVSIKVKINSPYADGVPVPTPGGGWLLQYHQENPSPGKDTTLANDGLRQCIADQVPVGVLREHAPPKHQTRYDVLGLAQPVQLSEERFYFESLNPKAVPAVDPVSDILEAIANAQVDQEDATERATLDDDYDARLRVRRQIVARQGQATFRASLVDAYGGRCAITGFDAVAALEGAHLRPYRGPESNSVTNGLLLRADIHTLFDLSLLAPDPHTRVIVVSKLLMETQYATFSNSRLAAPAAAWQRPDQKALQAVWQRFCEAEDQR